MKPPYPPDWMIIEGMMTTMSPLATDGPTDHRLNIAPMGPVVDPTFHHFVFRPFKTSTTYRNLKGTGEGVFHIMDDALLIARAAVGTVAPGPDMPIMPSHRVRGVVLANACRYYELKVTGVEDHEERTTIRAVAVGRETLRDFVGFNRARHAVLEAAIMATRLHLTGAAAVLAEITRLRVIVDKTGTDAEHLAMDELQKYVEAHSKRAGDEK
ncbi:MAG: DUF447 family protein [Planctomycetes bacterium]|nr:DUF447 family protein [Planctomycetota bacterium]